MPIDFPKSGASSTFDPASPASFTSSPSYPSEAAFEKHERDTAAHTRGTRSQSGDGQAGNGDDEEEDEDEDDEYDEDEESAMIQAEWEESMRQLEAVVSIVLIPFFGKWWGRKWAFWGECF
jgi:hypothetical protein